MEPQWRTALTGLAEAEHNPHILDRPPPEGPADMQFTSHARGATILLARPVEAPGPDELSEQLQSTCKGRIRG